MKPASVSSLPRSCATCGDSFQPTSNRQKYCSSCGRRTAAICEVCGKLFKVNPTTTGRWCSQECWGISRRAFDRKPRACEVCGDQYKPVKSDQRYCSKDCSGVASRRAEWNCAVCGKPYSSKHYTNTCSRDCAGKLRRKYADGLTCERCGKRVPWTISRTKRFCSRECRASPVGTRSTKGANGYMRIMTADGWKLEHRHVMEQQLGRPLESWERVHHRDGNRQNNDPSNLELWKVKSQAAAFPKDPPGVRASDYHCPGCRCGELTT